MASEGSQDTPLGVLLIATFWIFMGVWFLALMSSYGYYNTIVSLFFTLAGTFFIILGWGLIILKKWAYSLSLIMSLLGLFSTFYGAFSLVYILFSGYSHYSVIFLTTFLFIPMAVSMPNSLVRSSTTISMVFTIPKERAARMRAINTA